MATNESLHACIDQGIVWRNPRGEPEDRWLVVFVHGLSRLRGMQTSDIDPLLTSLMESGLGPFDKADLLAFRYQSSLWLGETMDAACRKLARQIDEAQREFNYQSILIIAHSTGTLIVRRAVLDEHRRGDNADSWVHRIDRMLFLAGTNRGFVNNLKKFTPSNMAFYLLSFFNQFWLDFLEIWPSTLDAGVKHTAVMRGSPWIRTLRLAWLRTFEATEEPNPPLTIMLRGDVDELVDADDDMDLYRPENCHVAVVQGMRHSDWTKRVELDEEVPEFTGRHFVFRTPGGAIHWACRPELPAPRERFIYHERHRRLVFLVHGIRDHGDWQENLGFEIKRKFQEQGVDPNDVKIVNVRYGYFTALQFLLSSQRQHSVRAFADIYIEEIARNPSLSAEQIVVAAHSNGTFAVAEACRQQSEICFGRVLLAGSVLPSRYFENDAKFLGSDRQVNHVLNHCFSQDWPVGILCTGVRWIVSRTGNGGFLGFQHNDPSLVENRYFRGSHGTPVSATYHAAIADYLVHGRSTDSTSRIRHWWFEPLTWAANLLSPVALAVLLFIVLLPAKEPMKMLTSWTIPVLGMIMLAPLLMLRGVRAISAKMPALWAGVATLPFVFVGFAIYFTVSNEIIDAAHLAIVLGSLISLFIAWMLLKL